jgi:uncharacterized membrane protein
VFVGAYRLELNMAINRGALLTGFGLGASAVYFLDVDRGGRRRALVRDKLVHVTNLSVDCMGATSRDVLHRSTGAFARLRGAVFNRTADDRILVERVRARLGRVVSHPHAIDVYVSDGVVTLRGPILQAEVTPLLNATASIRGVYEVINDLEVHKQAGGIPSLQGGAAPSGLGPDLWQPQWAPTTRLMVGTAGTALAAVGLSRRDIAGALLAAAGVGLFARAATNLEVQRLTGVGARRRAVDLQKTINIDAPVEEVFAFLTAYENFPRFMSRVLDVRPNARDAEWHWTVTGPAGIPVEFDAELSAFVPNRVFAWRTIEGSPVGHAGIVHFEPNATGGARVHIRMSYNPPGGWFGHGVAKAFGVDPKSSLDADLARLKTLIERGRPPRDAARPVGTTEVPIA